MPSTTTTTTTTMTALLWGGALIGVVALSTYSLAQVLLARPLQLDLEATRKKLKKEMDLRKMERAGRTKAERRLRQELKALIKGQTDGGVNLKPIARVHSPFKGRCGTPRQGLLAPNAKYVASKPCAPPPPTIPYYAHATHTTTRFLIAQGADQAPAGDLPHLAGSAGLLHAPVGGVPL